MTTTTTTTTADDKVRIAVAALFNTSMFDASICAGLKLIRVDDSDVCDTAMTDCHRTIWWSTEFFGKLPQAAVTTVIAHECRHVAYMHGIRRGDRDGSLWNVACDFVINRHLLDQGFSFAHFHPVSLADFIASMNGAPSKTPKGADSCLLDTMIGIEESAEDIYSRLLQARPPKPSGKPGQGVPSADGQDSDPSGASAMSGDMDYDALAKEMADKTEAQVRGELTVRVAQAIEAAKAVGLMPAALQRLAESFERPSVDWRKVLRRLVIGAYGAPKVYGDWSYRRPNKRYTNGMFPRPSLVREPCEPLAVCIDTSGSVDQAQLNRFAAELRGIITDVRPSRVYVIYCDAAVQGVKVFEQREPIKLELLGGGGTAFQPPFLWLADNAPDVRCVVYLTDGYGSFDFTPPSRRTVAVWGITTDVEAPWGHTVPVKL